MNLQFTDKPTGNEFSLGTYSFGFLNQKDVFDEADKETGRLTERIVWLDKDGCKDVAEKSKQALSECTIRKDLEKKIRAFIGFLEKSSDVSAYIL